MVRLRISYNPMTNSFCRYYASLGPDYGFFTISIDGSKPERLSAKNTLPQSQRMLWSNTDLSPGRHNVTLTHDDANSTTVSLDFFRSVPSEVRRQR